MRADDGRVLLLVRAVVTGVPRCPQAQQGGHSLSFYGPQMLENDSTLGDERVCFVTVVGAIL